MKRKISILLLICSIVQSFSAFTLMPNAASVDDLNYSITWRNEVTITDCNTSATGALEIPSTIEGYPVKYIASSAFEGCTSLTSITIPDSVTSIGGSAFYGCASLTSITIPDGVTSIGSDTFKDCTSLMSITIPNSVTSIGAEAFYNCKSLTSITIPDGVTSIGFSTFYECSSLTSINIPEGVTSIGGDAFEGCTNLTGVYITDIVAWYGISFNDASSNPLFYAKNLYLDGKLVTDLVIPDSVTSIGKYAFEGCSSLASITIPEGVTNIGMEAFYNCKSLTSITIPDSVTSISASAFYGCSSLTSITIPEGVTSIGSSAFFECSSLESITIPDSVTSIYYSVFYGCESLTEVYITDIAAWCGIAFYDEKANPLYYAGNLYLDGELVTNLVIPDSVTSIGDSAFEGCTSLTYVTISDNVSVISRKAFYGCDNIRKIYLPKSLTLVSQYNFNSCSKLTDVYYGGSEEDWANVEVLTNNKYLSSATMHYNATEIEYTVTFKNWDGTVISSKDYLYGDTVEIPNDPSRNADKTYTYSFAGWDKEITNVSSDIVYTAVYDSNYIDYTITFKNWNGTVLSEKIYHYGDSVAVPATPSREADENNTYSFAGWDSNVVACDGDKIYTATYTANTFTRGDVDGDNDVDADDYILLKRVFFGMTKLENLKNPETALARSDVYGDDGVITADDYILLKRVFFGMAKLG